MEKKVKAFPFYMDNSGCDYHRVRLPFQYSSDLFDNDAHIGFSPDRIMEYLEKSEVIVFNRHFALGMERMKSLQAKGIKFVADMDDWVELPNYHPQYKNYKNGDAKMILDMASAADCVTVTTERLYKKFLPYNKSVHILPNCLPYGQGQFTFNGYYEGPYNFIYTGQTSHLEDVRLMQSAMNKVSKLPIAFTLAGYKENRIFNAMEQVYKVIPDYRRVESKPLTSYMEVYDLASCAVVPLCFNEFNSCKSNLKILEAAAKKLPVIVSHVPPYRDDPEAPVLWVKEPSDWVKHMKYLSENPDKGKELGQQLFEWAHEKYNYRKWNEIRFSLYKSLK